MENIRKNQEIPTSEKKASNLVKQGITSPPTETASTNDAISRGALNEFIKQNAQSIFYSEEQKHAEKDQACSEERHIKKRRPEFDEPSEHSSPGLTGEMTNLSLTQDGPPLLPYQDQSTNHSFLENLQTRTEKSSRRLSDNTRPAGDEHLSPHTTDWKDHIPDWKNHIGPLVALVETIHSLETQQKGGETKLVSLNETIDSLQEKKQKYISQSEDLSQQINECREYMKELANEYGDTWLSTDLDHEMPLAVSTRDQYMTLATKVADIEKQRIFLVQQTEEVQDQLNEEYQERSEISSSQLKRDLAIKTHEREREQLSQKYSSTTAK